MRIINGLRLMIHHVSRDEAGVTAVEYGLFAALIAGVIAAIVTTIGTDLNTMFTTLSGKL